MHNKRLDSSNEYKDTKIYTSKILSLGLQKVLDDLYKLLHKIYLEDEFSEWDNYPLPKI